MEWANMEVAVAVAEDGGGGGARTYKCAPIKEGVADGNGGWRWGYRRLENEMNMCIGHQERKVTKEKERHVKRN